MATMEAKIAIRALDQFSGPMARMSNNALNAYSRMNRGMVARTARTSRQMAGSMQGAGGLGMSYLGATVIKNGYAFDKQLRFIGANATLTEDKIGSLGNSFADLALNYPKTRLQIAKGASEFITAGNSVDDLKYSIEDIAKASIASQATMAKVAADGTDVMAAYYGAIKDPKEKAKRLNEIFNLMAVGASSANHSWAEQTLAMQYSVPVVQALGLSLEQTTAMIGVLADNGFKGEKGGSALRTILLKLISPGKKAAQVFAQLGIERDKAFKFNKTKAFDAGSLGRQMMANYGGLSSQVNSVLSNTLNDFALQVDPFKMKSVLVERLSKAMNIREGDLVSVSNLRRVIDRHFQAATENLDVNYLFDKLGNASAPQLENLSGVKRTPQALKLARGFHDQYLPKLAKIEAEKTGALERRMGIFLRGFSADIDRMNSSLDNLSHRLENSGLTSFVSDLAQGAKKAVDYISTLNPTVLKFAGYALIMGAVLAPLGLMLSGLASFAVPLMALGKAGLFFTGLPWAATALGFTGLTKGAGGLKGALTGLPKKLRATALGLGMLTAANGGGKMGFFKTLGGGLLALGRAPFALIAGGIGSILTAAAPLMAIAWPVVFGVAAIALIIAKWEGIKAFFSGFFKKWATDLREFGNETGLTSVFDAIGSALGTVADYAGKAWDFLTKLFGVTDGKDKNGLKNWFDAGTSAADLLLSPLRAVTSAIKTIKRIASAPFRWFGGSSPKVPSMPSRPMVKTARGMRPAPAAVSAPAPVQTIPTRSVEARAKGGDVDAGEVVVGEKGPERLLLKQPGTVIPNHKIDRLAKARAGAKAAALSAAMAITPVAAAAGTGQAAGNKTITINAPITITIDGSGGNAQDIAQQVERALSQKLSASINAAMHDGGL